MGEMADDAIEDGLDAQARHDSGYCDEDCEWCREEDDALARALTAMEASDGSV